MTFLIFLHQDENFLRERNLLLIYRGKRREEKGKGKGKREVGRNEEGRGKREEVRGKR
jgi:hypothetical protein